MADEKKSDDRTVDVEKVDGDGDRFKASSQSQPPQPKPTPSPSSDQIANHPLLPILSYCGSSILMTVTNKYVLSGLDFNLNFFLLCVQVRASNGTPDFFLFGHISNHHTVVGLHYYDPNLQGVGGN